MAVTSYELLDATRDATTTRTLLHESIPLTGTIHSGTYGTFPDEGNIKNYAHGQFQSVYDYPYLSSSANHIFDLTVGYDEASPLSASSTTRTQQKKKINMYNQFSQVLLGYTGAADAVRKFESDLTLDETAATLMKEAFFINLSRLITKDQIKKGSFSVTLGTGSWALPFVSSSTLTDSASSDTAGTTNTVGGDYGLLSGPSGHPRGLIFYQSGIVVLTASAFSASSPNGATAAGSTQFFSQSRPADPYMDINAALTGASITASCDALRHRIQNISFTNTTEINSSIYFCRVPHNKYNYSSNPTYLSSSTVRVKSVNTDTPISYITTIGLYNSSNELLATAKLSEPLRKDPNNELTLRVRLDY